MGGGPQLCGHVWHPWLGHAQYAHTRSPPPRSRRPSTTRATKPPTAGTSAGARRYTKLGRARVKTWWNARATCPGVVLSGACPKCSSSVRCTQYNRASGAAGCLHSLTRCPVEPQRKQNGRGRGGNVLAGFGRVSKVSPAAASSLVVTLAAALAPCALAAAVSALEVIFATAPAPCVLEVLFTADPSAAAAAVVQVLFRAGWAILNAAIYHDGFKRSHLLYKTTI